MDVRPLNAALEAPELQTDLVQNMTAQLEARTAELAAAQDELKESRGDYMLLEDIRQKAQVEGDAEIARLQQEVAQANSHHAITFVRLQRLQELDERNIWCSNAVQFLVPYCKLLEQHIEQYRTADIRLNKDICELLNDNPTQRDMVGLPIKYCSTRREAFCACDAPPKASTPERELMSAPELGPGTPQAPAMPSAFAKTSPAAAANFQPSATPPAGSLASSSSKCQQDVLEAAPTDNSGQTTAPPTDKAAEFSSSAPTAECDFEDEWGHYDASLEQKRAGGTQGNVPSVGFWANSGSAVLDAASGPATAGSGHTVGGIADCNLSQSLAEGQADTALVHAVGSHASNGSMAEATGLTARFKAIVSRQQPTAAEMKKQQKRKRTLMPEEGLKKQKGTGFTAPVKAAVLGWKLEAAEVTKPKKSQRMLMPEEELKRQKEASATTKGRASAGVGAPIGGSSLEGSQSLAQVQNPAALAKSAALLLKASAQAAVLPGSFPAQTPAVASELTQPTSSQLNLAASPQHNLPLSQGQPDAASSGTTNNVWPSVDTKLHLTHDLGQRSGSLAGKEEEERQGGQAQASGAAAPVNASASQMHANCGTGSAASVEKPAEKLVGKPVETINICEQEEQGAAAASSRTIAAAPSSLEQRNVVSRGKNKRSRLDIETKEEGTATSSRLHTEQWRRMNPEPVVYDCPQVLMWLVEEMQTATAAREAAAAAAASAADQPSTTSTGHPSTSDCESARPAIPSDV